MLKCCEICVRGDSIQTNFGSSLPIWQVSMVREERELLGLLTQLRMFRLNPVLIDGLRWYWSWQKEPALARN